MKKIQAKKKRERTEAEMVETAPHSGQPVKNLLDDDDELPTLF